MSCCNLPLSLRYLEKSKNLTNEQLEYIINSERSFSEYDNKVLYFITISMIINNFILIFLMIDTGDPDFNKRVVIAECLFLIIFSFVLTLIRISIIKFLMLHPILTMWKELYYVIIDKWMIGYTAFSALIGCSLMIGVTICLFVGNLYVATVLTCIDCIIYMTCILFYRLHVGVYIKKISSIRNINEQEPILQ